MQLLSLPMYQTVPADPEGKWEAVCRAKSSRSRRQPRHRSGNRARFAEEGADISFCYRSNKAGADAVVASIHKTGRKVRAFNTTSESFPTARKFIADTAAQFGKIDVLVITQAWNAAPISGTPLKPISTRY